MGQRISVSNGVTFCVGNRGVGNLRFIGLVGLGPASRVFTFHLLDSLLTATPKISICPHMTSYSNIFASSLSGKRLSRDWQSRMTRVRLPFESAIAGSGPCCWKDCLDRKMNIPFAEPRTFSSFFFSRQRMISHSVYSCILALWFNASQSISQKRGSRHISLLSLANTCNFASVAQIMKTALSKDVKLFKEAKECMQKCVREFISFITFITSEDGLKSIFSMYDLYSWIDSAAKKCWKRERKIISGKNIVFVMKSLAFKNYGGTEDL